MQLRKDYHVEVNEHSALMVCRAFLFVLLAHFMLGNTCIGIGKQPDCFLGLIFNGVVKEELYEKDFMKIFFFFNLHLILFVYFIITAKSETVKWIDVVLAWFFQM